MIGAFAAVHGAEAAKGPLDFTMTSIDGKPIELANYKGKVVLIVNVASKCGLTPQYEALEALYKKYQDRGFVILGFPANEFGHQEPGTNEEIVQFCKSKYSVDFPMFAKIVVKGDGISPLYQYLTSAESDPKYPGEIKWNFEKFLVDRNGQIVNRFEPRTKPDSPEVTGAIEAELAKK
ncbi:MAG TPA: glutathione peroxidase [Pirellulales bacterium]|nr:glutathione peroxidase [Pirellulales bacterium]